MVLTADSILKLETLYQQIEELNLKNVTPWTVAFSNNSQINVYRIEIDIELGDLYNLLDQTSIFPKVFWKSKRSAKTKVCFGKAKSFTKFLSSTTISQGSSLTSPEFFISKPFFDTQSKEHWSSFSNSQEMLLPKIECLKIAHSQSTIALNYLSPPCAHLIKEDLQDLVSSTPAPSFHLNVSKRVDTPSFETWEKSIHTAQAMFEKTPLKKVVLARKASLEFNGEYSPVRALKDISSKSVNTTVFLWQPEPSTAFLASTPETLFIRDGQNLTIEAIAGTRPAGTNSAQRSQYEKELLTNEKEAEEFNYVKSFVQTSATTLCSSVSHSPSPNFTRTSYVTHSYDAFKGTLKPNISDSDILKLLHPTPAVAGTPTKESLELINKIETFSRGYYASPIGWSSSDYTELAVAIRSAVIFGNCLHIYSGVGVVKGSDPKKEWEELELKIADFLNLDTHEQM